MAEKRARLSLARVAAGMAAGHASTLPALILMTDDDRLPDPLAAVRALPRGSMVIVRARRAREREQLALRINAIAGERDLIVSIADDAALVARLGVNGLHLPEVRSGEAVHWRARHPQWLITASLHGLRSTLPGALDAILLSPVFPTQSHAGRPALGAARAAGIARQLLRPVYALGGIDARNARQLAGVFVGIAAIGSLEV